MGHLFTERNLPVLQALGMIGLATLATLGVGVFVIWSFMERFDSSLIQAETQAIAVQENLLDNQLSAVTNRLDYERARTETYLREQVRGHTEMGLSIARSLVEENQGRLSEAEIKTLIIETLRPLRFFNGRGYFFIGTLEDGDTKAVLIPSSPELEGRSIWDTQDARGKFTAREIVRSVDNPQGEGFSSYMWFPPGQTTMREKITHARRIDSLGWIIGSGEYTYQVEEDLKKKALAEITDIRFGHSGYVTVLDLSGTMLASANNPELVNVPLHRLPEDSRAVTEQILSVAENGGGTIRYEWERPGGREKIRKLTRTIQYEPWGWVLATGVYLDDIDQIINGQRADIEKHVTQQVGHLGLVMIAVFALSLGLSTIFGRWMHRILDTYASNLEARNRDLVDSRNRLKLHAQVFDSSGEAMMISDADSQVLSVNPAFTRITGFEAEEARGLDPTTFLDRGHHDEAFAKALWVAVRETGNWAGEIWSRRKDGEAFPAWLSVGSVRGEAGRVSNFIGILTDITQRKAAEDKIRELAFYDPLTQLPNRRLLRDRLEQAIAAANRSGHHGAVLFIDLDNFKTLNDTRGHDVGDLLLVEVAKRLSHCLRDQDTVARLGGDEFIVVLVNLDKDEHQAATQVEKTAAKIAGALNKTYDLSGLRYHISPSIGACLFHWAQDSADTLLRHADTAMYQAKNDGRNRLRFFDPAMQKALMERARLESELRDALARKEMLCLHQPQVDGAGQIIGAEVLLRWRHPILGMVSPLAFIPLAEDTGLIVPIGAWVLDQACRRLAIWSRYPETRDLVLAVNVSAVQFREPDFVEFVERTLAGHGVDPRSLKLELTESLVLEDVEGTITTMKHLKALGVGFSMDDFGTGQSSLTYLKRLPLDQLKIDQSFVRDITSDPSDAVIVRTIIAMAHSMGLDVLAEGVETAEQRDFLLSNGCERFQGYYFGKPMEIDAFETKAGLSTLTLQ